MVWDFIKNSIPWWVYLIAIVAGGAVLWVYFGPIILAVWARLPNWVKYVLTLVGAVSLAIVYGRNKGFADARAAQKRLDERAVRTRQETHDEVEKLDEPTVDKRLDKWMRD